MNTFIIVFIVVGVIGGIIANSNKLSYKMERILRFSSVTFAVLGILYLLVPFMDFLSKEVSAYNVASALGLGLLMLAIGNLVFYATSRYNDEKESANLAQYELHLISQGMPYSEVNKKANDIVGGGRKSLQADANQWANRS